MQRKDRDRYLSNRCSWRVYYREIRIFPMRTMSEENMGDGFRITPLNEITQDLFI